MIDLKHYVNGVLICVLFLSSCAAAPSRTDHGALTKRPRPKIDLAGLEHQVHDLVNKERRKHGLSQFAWDETLARIARNYSRDMSQRNFFDHYSPEGHDFSKRYQQSGYQCAVRINRTIHKGAENIALNHLYDSVTTINGKEYYDWNSQEKIAETTVQGWMKSPGHRKNILTPYFSHEGIGISITSDGKVYITQNFC